MEKPLDVEEKKEDDECGPLGEGEKCPEPDYSGSVTYSFKGIDPCPGHPVT